MGDNVKFEKKKQNVLSFEMKSIVMLNIFCGQISHCVCNHKCIPKKNKCLCRYVLCTIQSGLYIEKKCNKQDSIFHSMSQKIFSAAAEIVSN